MLLERRLPVAVAVRKGNPELKSALQRQQPAGVGIRQDRKLGVGYATPRRHDVQFPGPDHHIAAHAVPVPDVPGERPRDGLQSGVRVGEH